MPVPEGIIKSGSRQYSGFRLIRIEKVPAYLPAGLDKDILTRCRQSVVSAELTILSPDSVKGSLDLLLILRATGTNARELKERLDMTADSAMGFMTHSNIKSSAVSAQKAVDFFLAACKTTQTGLCFYPPESLPEKAGVYIPGRYNEPGLRPVDLGGMCAIAAANPGSVIAISAAPAGLTALELRGVRLYADRLRALKDNQKAKTAAGLYADYLTLVSESNPVFTVSFHAFGNPSFIQDLAARVSLSGLHHAKTPPAIRSPYHYLYYGSRTLAAVSYIHGHEAPLRGKLIKSQFRLTHMCGISDLTSAFPLPQDLSAIEGLRINRAVTKAEPLPEKLTDPEGIFLGTFFKTGQDIYIPPDALTRHGFFSGKPGSGKTVFALGLLYRLYRHKNKYPFLAFEPAKKEYRSLLGPIPDLRVYTPGRQDIAPIQLNLFLPPEGVRLEQYQPLVETIFTLAVAMPHPLDVIFPQVISRCYAHYGWRPDSTRDSEGVRVFGLHEFIIEFRKYAEEKYGNDSKQFHNIESGGIVRLQALLDSPTFNTDESLDIEELLTHPTVIEMDALSNNRQRAIVMGILLSKIMVFLQHRGTTDNKLTNLILIDEAHLLLDQNDFAGEDSAHSGAAVLEMLQNMTLILRAYGTSLIFGDQSAERLTSVIMSNVNLKIMFRTDSIRDRQLLAQEAQLTEQMTDSMGSLPPGQGYMYCDLLYTPVYMVVPDTEKLLNLNKQLPDEAVRDHMKIRLKPPYFHCSTCPECHAVCDNAIRSDARFIARQLLELETVRDCLPAFKAKQKALLPAYLKEGLPGDVKQIMDRFRIEANDMDRRIACSRIHVIRELLISPECLLDEEDLMS